MKKKKYIEPEIVIPKGYDLTEILDMSNDFGDEKPILAEEVKLKFE